MTSLELWILRTSVALGVIVMAVRPAEAGAASAPSMTGKGELRMEDRPGENRLVVTLGPIRAPGSGAETLGVTIAGGGRLVRSAMAHRLRVQLVDADQRPVEGAAAWEANLFAGSSARPGGLPARPMARFDQSRPSVDLPKPLGYLLQAGDSVIVVATIDASASPQPGELHLVVTIEYEPLDGPVSRLAVIPVDLGAGYPSAEAAAGEGELVLQRSWDWTAEIGGRILALTGTAVESAHEIILDDPSTGAVLWRTTYRHDAGAGLVRSSQCVRLGVVVEAGRTYRLTVIVSDTSARTKSAGSDVVRALILPNRAPAHAAKGG